LSIECAFKPHGGDWMSKQTTNLVTVQYIVITYNIVEATFAIVFGLLSRSMALTGFAIEGAVESLNEIIIAGNDKKSSSALNDAATGTKQKPVILVAAISFILGSYVLVQSLKMLILQIRPLPSAIGIVIAVCSLVFMPLLAFWSYYKMNSAKIALHKGMRAIGGYLFLSFGLLLGLGLNFWAGFWQADPVVGLLTAGYLYKKSLESLVGNNGQSSK
jgi:Predicted Co/Zn/Cd cation transporters